MNKAFHFLGTKLNAKQVKKKVHRETRKLRTCKFENPPPLNEQKFEF